jgi:hypothetical protein
LAHGAFLTDAEELTHGGRSCSTAACPNVLRQSNSRQQPDNGNHDHQFDQGEASAGAGRTACAQGAQQFKLSFGFHGVFGGGKMLPDKFTLAAGCAHVDSASPPEGNPDDKFLKLG